MKLTLGKKIGGGFALTLLLTCIVGGVALWAMNHGVAVSSNIAEDRVPRMVTYSSLQNNLLLAAYNTRVYFEARDQKALDAGYDYLEKLKQDVATLERLNSIIYFTNTADFLKKFSSGIADYEASIRKCAEYSRQINETTTALMAAGNIVFSKLENMIQTMSETQREFLAVGDMAAARQYSQNLADASALYGRMTNVTIQLLTADRNQNFELFTAVRDELPKLQQAGNAIRGNLARQECRDLFDDASRAYQEFSSQADRLATLQMESIPVMADRVRLYTDLYHESVDMMTLTTKNTSTVVNDAETTLSASTRTVGMLLVVILVVGIILSLLITRMVVNPLARTQVFAQAVAGGDLDKELDVHSRDETGMLADALRNMVHHLKENIDEAHQKSEEARQATEEARAAMTRAEEAARQAEAAKREGMLAAANQLEGVVEIISSASTELAAQIEQSDKSARLSAERLTEAATAMNEMNSTVQEVARNASATAQVSAETKQNAVTGAEIVRQSLESTEQVHKLSLQLKEDMAELDHHAASISSIMNVISDIADQTNLLALNAAIEAARAGEAGRGFAVVADEVRNLAEKTMAATREVGEAVTAIQTSTAKSVQGVDDAVTQIAQSSELAHQSGAALEDIVNNADAASEQVSAIAAASEEQSAASEEINQSIDQANSISAEVAQTMGEASKAISDLAVQAQELSRLIEDMKQA